MIFATAVAMLFAAGCATEYDDTPIWNEIDSINDRIDDLEDLCRELNNDIESVQKLVDSLENNDYVTAVTPIVKNGETIGYTISFTKSEPITIYHGEDGTDGEDGRDGEDGEDGRDGRDGNIPNIGVKKHTDGRYYWTINGDWLLDNNGNKVPATGEDGKDGVDGEDGTNGKDGIDGEDGNNGTNGKDGITPVLKIENNYWYVSYDNGLTWTRLDKSIDDSCNGGSSIFKSVTQDKDNVYFTLTDGTVITVPLATSNALYRLQSISYVPAYSDGKALVEFTTPSDSYVVMDFELAPMDVATEIANNWEELLSMKAVGVETRASTLIDMEVIACEADDQGIITVTASCENLSDDFFAGYQYMNARLEIADESFNHKSEYVPMITINHESTDKPIIPVTPTIKNNQIIYTTVDGNSIQPSKYANFGANIVSNEYINGKGIITFDKDITIIPNDAFINNLTLLSVILPNQVETIGSSAFSGCKYLEQVTIGKYTLSIGGNAFYGCININTFNCFKYKFIPERSGAYHVYSTGESDSVVFLMAEDRTTQLGDWDNKVFVEVYQDENGVDVTDPNRKLIEKTIPWGRDATVTEASLTSASATANPDGGYTMVITFIAEDSNFDGTKNTSEPTQHMTAMDPLNLGSLDLGPISISEAALHYPGATMTATVDSQGRLVKLEQKLPLEGTGTGKAGIPLTLEISGSMDGNYEFIYG